jgi:hypothetical protein
MTLSIVAVVTDVIRNGTPVIGYGFNSNGRYGQGTLMRGHYPVSNFRQKRSFFLKITRPFFNAGLP